MSSAEPRVEALEKRIAALEEAIGALRESLAEAAGASGSAPDDAVVTLLARQLQRLVPKTCEHPPEEPSGEVTLEGTDVLCTEEVKRRVKRIPIPFVREMVIRKVAEFARAHQIARVDLETFEKAATF